MHYIIQNPNLQNDIEKHKYTILWQYLSGKNAENMVRTSDVCYKSNFVISKILKKNKYIKSIKH